MIINLTDYEMKLVTDPEVLLTKNRVIQKVYELFGRLAEEYKTTLNDGGLPAENEIAAKISRGENYRGLPYVILDYPRRFDKVDVFAVRTFFWWGNFFSITLQLSGAYQQKYGNTIQSLVKQKIFSGWFIGSSETAWQHHFENDNYRPIHYEENYELSNFPHIKVAKKIPLSKWDEAEVFLKENFTFLIKALNS